jgi:endonuclease/exonuclease/phosphatase family metal-dependent hydrolase
MADLGRSLTSQLRTLLLTTVYEASDGPKFEGHFAGDPLPSPEHIKVVSYNINLGLAIPQAIDAFQCHAPLQDADVILLQEMDEAGSEQMARALGCNFVYFPGSVARHGRNFGNAILTRWRLSAPHKLILPYRHPINGVLRLAVRANVRIGDLDALVYSVHTETYTVPPFHRKAQVQAILDDIGEDAEFVIAGGDFNTVSGSSIRGIRQRFAGIGMARSSAGAGPTVAKFGTRPSAADHIFTRGFRKVASGKVEDAAASDHFPLWVTLRPTPKRPSSGP